MSDDYKTAPMAGPMKPAEREYIRHLAIEAEETCKDSVPLFVGIGVMWGGSFHCMRAGSERAEIYGIDIDYTTYPIYNPGGIKARKWILADSRFFDWHKENINKINYLFIDGDHHYDTVKADILNWRDTVAIGGILAFHDYAPIPEDLRTMPHLDGVRQAVDELIKTDMCFEPIGQVDSVIAFRRIV
jgi:hypothetical protein